MARRTNRRTKPRDRRARDTSKATPRPNADVTSAQEVEGQIHFTLNADAFYVGGVPAILLGSTPPIAVSAITQNSFKLVWAAPPVEGMSITIPQDDPAFRTRGGGYIAATSMPVEF
jgi:hypothetical protein